MGAIYADDLVEITDRGVTFHHYYFPFGDKRVEWSRISSIEARQPSVKTGSWRIWGTGNLSTWFPLDARRPRRDRILFAALGDGSSIGFTVENSAAVIDIFKQRGLLRESSV